VEEIDQENVNNEQEEGYQVAAKNRKNNSAKKYFSDLGKKIVNAVKGDAKSIFLLKAELIKYAVLAAVVVLVFFALIIEGNAEETSAESIRAASDVYANSTSTSAEMYNSTGSLILATDSELEEIKNKYLEKQKKTNESYFNALSTEYPELERIVRLLQIEYHI